MSSKQDWYKKNKERTLERSRLSEVKKRVAIRAAKSNPCKDCGFSYPYYVMQFDHVRGKKLFNIAEHHNTGIKKLLEEIAKCDIVCANCHAERTHKRQRINSAEECHSYKVEA